MKEKPCPKCSVDLNGWDESVIKGYFITKAQARHLSNRINTVEQYWFKKNTLKREHCPSCQHIYKPTPIPMNPEQLKVKQLFAVLNFIKRYQNCNDIQISKKLGDQFLELWQQTETPYEHDSLAWAREVTSQLNELGEIKQSLNSYIVEWKAVN